MSNSLLFRYVRTFQSEEISKSLDFQRQNLYVTIPTKESTHDRVIVSRAYENRRAGIHRKGGVVERP